MAQSINIDLPRITVITVTRNADAHLEQTIQSVIEQDYPNLEYIIIDGASTDGTLDIIRRYESYITKWISEPDRGIYDAMNKGIALATGDWLFFMGGDDSFCTHTTLSGVAQKLGQQPTCFAYCDFEISHGSQTSQVKQDLFAKWSWWYGKYPPYHHQSLFISRSALSKAGNYNIQFRIHGDYDLICKIKGSCYPIYIPLSAARFNDAGYSGATLKSHLISFSELFRIRSRLDDFPRLGWLLFFFRMALHFCLKALLSSSALSVVKAKYRHLVHTYE